MRRAPREVFLSHATRDRRFASKLADALGSHGVPVWYSRRTIQAARQWHDEIGRALARCDWFLLVLSPAAVRSEWVKRELLYALQQRRYREHIAPVLYRPCSYQKLSWTLDSIQRIDLTGDFARGCRDLLRLWGIDGGARGPARPRQGQSPRPAPARPGRPGRRRPGRSPR